jgi:hypothetical protein
MSLSALEIERRVEQMLASRVRNSGQLNGLDGEQLDGIGKALKKVAKKVGKVVKKIAPIAVGGIAAYAGFKATKSLLGGKKKKAAAASVAAAQQAVSSGALSPQTQGSALDTASTIAQSMLAQQVPAAAADPGMQQILRQAVAAEMYAQQPQQGGGGGGSPASFMPSAQPTQELDEVTITANRLKPYLIPGALAAGLLVLLMANRQKRKG